MLRPTSRFTATSLDEVAGCLRAKRKLRKAGQERAAIKREVNRRREVLSLENVHAEDAPSMSAALANGRGF